MHGSQLPSHRTNRAISVSVVKCPSVRRVAFRARLKEPIDHHRRGPKGLMFSRGCRVSAMRYRDLGTEQEKEQGGESSSEPGRFEKFSIGMSGMITKLSKASQPQPLPLDNNPILQYFEVGAESSTAGPGLIWRIHDAYRKSDGKSRSPATVSAGVPTRSKPDRKARSVPRAPQRANSGLLQMGPYRAVVQPRLRVKRTESARPRPRAGEGTGGFLVSKNDTLSRLTLGGKGHLTIFHCQKK
ncbi:unnamed protein product [Spodoptera exigua]|nr:unnamed protein product [Spodoptera exigua]